MELGIPTEEIKLCKKPESAFAFSEGEKSEYIEVFLEKENGHNFSKPIKLYLLEGLRADIVMGREDSDFVSRIDLNEGVWNITQREGGESMKLNFDGSNIEHYLPNFSPLLAKMDCVLPPRSQNRVRVTHKVCGEGYVVAPTTLSEAGLTTAWGICNTPEWVQVLNLTDSFVTVKKGSKVALAKFVSS